MSLLGLLGELLYMLLLLLLVRWQQLQTQLP
jgi:hypothetical protein